MKITVSNKRTELKPTKENAGKFFKGIKFKTYNAEIKDFRKIIENGYVLGYQCLNDDNMKRKTGFIGTQFIVIDVDATELKSNELLTKCTYKPTILHTTFSNLTENKDYKYCYHLIYCLEDQINNEADFNEVFELFASGYRELVDNNAKDCHRLIYTSNGKLKDFEYIELGNIYKSTDLLSNKDLDSIDSLFNNTTNVGKNSNSVYISSPLQYIQNGKNFPTPKNEFNLDKDFFKDLNTLCRSEFIAKYSAEFIYRDCTEISDDMYVDGYADLRGFDYYEVPTAQYSWDTTTNKAIVKKIQNGHRTTMLWLDAIAFCKIFPNLSKEHLVWLLVKEVYMHFMNGDNQLNNWFIINKAKEVYNNQDNLQIEPIKKKFKLDTPYWYNQGINQLEACRIVRSKIKTIDILSVYDFSSTLEENLKEMASYGMKYSKKSVKTYLEKNNLEYITEKDLRDKMVIYFYDEDNTRSSREIEKLCKDKGIKVSYKTIQSIISDYKLLGKN